MARFKYRIRDERGVMQEGMVDAASIEQASAILQDKGWSVLSLLPEASELHLEKYIPFLNKVSSKEIVIFSRQFSTLINARLPIIQALNILHEQVSSPVLKKAILQMISDIEGGRSLSESLARHTHIFSNLYINLVKSGEMSGTLDKSLEYLADQQEKDYELMSKVRGAMTYPIFIVSAIIIVGALMFVFVLPQMLEVLQEAGAELPLTTKILIAATEFSQQFWIYIIVILLAAAVAARIYVRSEGGRVIWDALKLRVPILGNVLQKIYLDRFARNLATLIAGGIPIVAALNAVGEIVGNTVYKQIIFRAAKFVENGQPIAEAFEQSDKIPAIVSQMIKIGEQTGSLDELLMKLAHFYDKEVESSVESLTKLLEPIIMIILGIAVAIMVAGILLPIYNLSSAM